MEELDIIYQKLEEWPSKQYISSEKIKELFIITVKGAIKHQSNGSIVLGVDALDECKDESISEFTRVFSDLVVNRFQSIKLVICSRYGVGMQIFRELLQKQILRNMDLANISSRDEDIKIYIKAKIKEIQSQYSQLDNNWLGDEKLAEMAEKAKGLFIWVKTAFSKFIF